MLSNAVGSGDFWLEAIAVDTAPGSSSIGVWSRFLGGLGLSVKSVLIIGVESEGVDGS